MRKTLVALAATVTGLIVAFAPTAANAYPDPVLTNLGGNAADGVVAPGENFTLTGQFDGVDCDPWIATFTGGALTPNSGSGTSFSVSGTAPTTAGSYTISFTCTYDDGTPAATTAPVAFTPGAVVQTVTLPFAVQVVSPGTAAPGTGTGTNASNGVLPSTGGPALLLLAAGGALVIAGGATVALRRRNA
ncbi:LPXTG cell wall anchor domain-containing protein [Aeromicrobium alkaliterrae]|uniref:Gram-positive cocci surface proteins LPxTG domain-containing protein n=1 Tax=Aeromicrobium alkaliterrae TaxID=302168 RepID=A0ABN2JZU1_9ACTN